MSRIGCRAGSLGVLLSLHRVLVTLLMVVLAVMLCSRAMRLGCAVVVIGRFGMGYELGIWVSPLSGEFLVRSQAASIVFAVSALVVLNDVELVAALGTCARMALSK